MVWERRGHAGRGFLGPPDWAKLARGLYEIAAAENREPSLVALLNTKDAVFDAVTVSVGMLKSARVHPREVFWPASRPALRKVMIAHKSEST